MAREVKIAVNRKADPPHELEIESDADTLEELKNAIDDAIANRTGRVNRVICNRALRVMVRRT